MAPTTTKEASVDHAPAVASASLEEMTRQEHAALAEAEARIEKSEAEHGRKIGLELRTIRDDRLYRATHASWEAYVNERWGMALSTAGRWITVAEEESRRAMNGQKGKLSQRQALRDQAERRAGGDPPAPTEAERIAAAARASAPRQPQLGEGQPVDVIEPDGATTEVRPPSPLADAGGDREAVRRRQHAAVVASAQASLGRLTAQQLGTDVARHVPGGALHIKAVKDFWTTAYAAALEAEAAALRPT